jgi:hypothetical protein
MFEGSATASQTGTNVASKTNKDFLKFDKISSKVS